MRLTFGLINPIVSFTFFQIKFKNCLSIIYPKMHNEMKSTTGKCLWAILLFSLLLSKGPEAWSQIPASSYSFSAQSGTFTEITGGTSVGSVESDEDISGAIPIGFAFDFCGNTYTDLIASSNGFLSFGAPTYAVGFNDIFALNDLKPALFPLWEDLNGDAGAAAYTTTGTAPNRVFTFQFKNWKWDWNAAGPVISFQVKLYETTNVIEYIYRQESNAVNGFFIGATIGITDGQFVPEYITINDASAAPVASSTTFTSGIATKPANGQIYRFSPPPPCNTISTWPAASAAAISPNTVCLSGNVTLSIATAMPITTGLTYQWQSSPTGTAPWTDVGTAANMPTQTVAVSAPLYFRCAVLCNGNTTTPVWTSDASPQVTVNNPGSPSATGATRCGPGTVDLTATGTASGPQIKWYTQPSGGAPIGSGSPWTTPYIPATTTFYVTAGAPDASAVQAVGDGLLTTNFDEFTPFLGWSGGYQHQFLIRASELTALGIAPGAVLTSLAFDVVTPGNTYNDFTVSLKNTTTDAFPGFTTGMETGTQVVRLPANHTTTTGINTFTFNSPTPFVWNGDNLLVQTCWSNNNSFNNASEVKYDEVPFAATQLGMGDSQPSSVICDVPPFLGWSSYNRRPKMLIGYTASCQGPRVPVEATVTPSPDLTVSAPEVVCNSAIATISVTPQGTPYTTYEWTDVTNLYTDASATTPYAAGTSATTLYFNAADAGEHVYYLFAENTATDCNHADTVRIWNQPASVTTTATPDTICNSGSTVISLVPGQGYFPGSIQWQESADGLSYTDIAGASDVVLTTPVLTDSRYYRALISAGPAVCEGPVKEIIVAHPEILTTADSFNCGPGTVVLQAEAGGNGNIRWYDDPTSITPVGEGSPWTTPYLAGTTTFYVGAATGAPQPEPTVVGSGTSVSSWTDVPYSLVFRGNKAQWLIKATELQAAGFNAGYINSIGFDVGFAGDEVENFSLSMKLTTANALVPPLETGMQTVFSAAFYQPVANSINVHNLTSLFYWDGTSNIILEECHNNAFTGTSSNVTLSYAGSGLTNNADVADHCTNPGGPTFTVSARPNVQIGMVPPCESPKEAVTAFIRPVPEVDLGADVNICVEPGQETLVLDAGVQPNNGVYNWDDGSTDQVRAVHVNGTYNVKVTNMYTCTGGDTINVIFRNYPLVDLGNDTTVCNGVILPLDAGSEGISYFWNTGETTAAIQINSPGMYNVFVTNDEGCTKTDTIIVDMVGQLPSVQGINIDNNGQNTFQFTAVNPQNVIGYDWDFGDGSAHSYLANPVHSYAAEGNYVVVLQLSSSCGFFADSVSAHMVGIHQLNIGNDELTVYPNPARNTATILNKSGLKMERVQVYNILGQIVYRADADSKDKHTLLLDGLSSGIYTVEVFTDKGTVARKLELMR